MAFERNPTLYPCDPFDPAADAETLRAAMKGAGTDERALFDVLARRTNAQRLEIADVFKTMYGKDLLDNLKSETDGKFEDVLVALMTPLPEYVTKEIHDALSGLGTDEEVLIEVFCAMNNADIACIKETYEKMYSSNLEDALKSDTSGTFKRMLVSLSTACRDEDMEPNMDAATEDAQKLVEAGELQCGTDESAFNMILCQRSYAQLHLIFDEYEKMTGNNIEDVIKSEFSGAAEDGYLAIVRSVRNRPAYFAKRLKHVMSGLGTEDKHLIRIVVTRCEVDMGDIKDCYEQMYGKTLRDAIADDISGDYKNCILTLLGDC